MPSTFSSPTAPGYLRIADKAALMTVKMHIVHRGLPGLTALLRELAANLDDPAPAFPVTDSDYRLASAALSIAYEILHTPYDASEQPSGLHCTLAASLLSKLPLNTPLPPMR
jgi:hypothetical protein